MTPIRIPVMPDGWSDHHRPAAYGFLTGTWRLPRGRYI